MVQEAVFVDGFSLFLSDFCYFKTIFTQLFQQTPMCVPVSLYVAQIKLNRRILVKKLNYSFHQGLYNSRPVHNVSAYYQVIVLIFKYPNLFTSSIFYRNVEIVLCTPV